MDGINMGNEVLAEKNPFRGEIMKKRIAMLALLAVVAGAVAMSFAGCSGGKGKSKSGVVELAFWGGWTGPDQKYMLKIVDEFNKQNPGVKVTLTTYQWDPMFNKLLMSFRGGNPPDIVAMHQSDIPQYAAMGILEEMDSPLTEMGLKAADFDAAAWEGFKYKDKMLAMPLDIHMFGMYYNVDMFKKAGLDPAKPPQDRASLLAAAKALTITDASGKAVQYGIGIPATHQHSYRYWYSFLYQNGGTFLTPDGKGAAFNSPQGEEAYQFLHDLIYKDKVAPEQEADVAKDFQSQKVAIIFDGPWWIPGMSDVKGLNFSVAPFPQIFAKRAMWANGHGLCMPKQASADPARRAAALKLLKFISDNSIEWAKGGQIPVRKSVRESPEFAKLTLLKPFMDSVPYVVYLPKLEKGSLIFASNASTPMMTAMEEITLNKKSPKDALTEAAAAVDGILKQ